MAGEIPKNIKASLYIDGKPAVSSIKEVEQGTQRLYRELMSLTKGTDAWNAKMKEVAANKKYLKEVKDEINGVGGAFGQLKQELGKIGTLAVGFLGFQFITSQFQGIISANAKLSDSLADIRRVAGLTEAAVLDLDRSLGKLDTRTSKSDLRGMAVIAGKLGVAKNEILSFVEATDKLTVALGDELGNADQITTQLGKILNVFEGKVTGDNITRLGNALVGLANRGVASGGFIAQYTQLISGIAKTAGVSLPATMALGAGLEELGGRAESSATATQKLLISITQSKEAYKIAGVSLAQFNKMLADAPEKALLLYAKGLTANKNAFAEVTAGLKDAGEEGARTVELITKLGQNTEFFNEKIANTGLLFQQTNEITDAFNLKNQNLAASTEKLAKDFNSLSTNTQLVNFLSKLVFIASDLTKWIKENSAAISQSIKIIAVVTSGWLGYQAAIKLAAAWTAITSGYLAAQRVVLLLVALAQAILTGNTLRAAAAQRVLGMAMVANPFGAVLAILTALTTAYVLFSSKVTTAAKIQEDFNSIRDKAQKSFIDEKNYINDLIKVIANENISRNDKLVAIKKLRDIMPEYLKQYTDEEILAGKAIGKINEYVAALERKSLAEAAQSKIRELQQKNIDLGSVENLSNVTETDKWIAGLQNFVGMDGTGRLVNKGIQRDRDEIASNNARIKEIQSSYGSVMVEQLVTPTPSGKSNGTVSATEKEINAAEAARKKALAEFERLDDQYKKLNLQRLNDKLSENEKEVKQEADKYDALIANQKDFLKELDANDKLKGQTAQQVKESKNQRKATNTNILQLDLDKEKAVADLRVRQEDEMIKKITELRTRLSNLHESELQKQKVEIDKFYDDLELKNKGNEAVLARLRLERLKELSEAELREKERLENEKQNIEEKHDTLVGLKPAQRLAKINKKYDDEIAALKLKFSKELQLTKAFLDAVALIEKNRNAEIKLEKKTAEDDKKLFALEMAQQTADATFSIMANNRQAETAKTIKSLENRRDAELENENLTADQKKEITDKYEAKIREEKLRAWKADQAAALAQVVVNGAVAITKAMAQFGPAIAPFLIPTIIAGVALQSGVILAQKPPEFASGGMTDQDPSGYVSNATIFNRSASGRPFMAGEAGKEWIAPNWMVNSPRFANIIGTLEVARKEKRMYAAGGFNNPQSPINNQGSMSYDFERLETMMYQLFAEQRRYNSIPVVLNYSQKEDFERKLEFDRAQQLA